MELRQRGVTRLDILIISHPDQDHYGNILAILRSIPTVAVVEYRFNKGDFTQYALLVETKRQNIPVRNVLQEKLAGTRQNLDNGVTLNYLAPITAFQNPNDNSIILRVNLKHFGLLFMGDAEEKERDSLLNSKQDLQATVLKVAHHGSRSGTNDALLTHVRPEVGIISSDLDNSYRHPDLGTLDALRQADIKVYRTDLQGTVTFQADGNSYKIGLSTK